MTAPALASVPASPQPPVHLLLAQEPSAPWSARALDVPVPPDTLGDARARRDELRDLLGRERAAAADFLLALADFDRRRGWERLGHASLFAFLTRELGLSSGAAQLRLSAARLLPRHPAVEAALRSGRLCISAVGQLARVLTPENEAEVLPRFLGLSAREAAEVAAAVLPRAAPPRREVLTAVPAIGPGAAAAARGGASSGGLPPPARSGAAAAGPEAPLLRCVDAPNARGFEVVQSARDAAASTAGHPAASAASCRAADLALHTHEVPAPVRSPDLALHTYEVPAPARVAPRTPAVEPLSADLRRLHLTVSKGFTDKLAAARTGFPHALPGATTEQVLEAALDLLLARQAQRRGLGQRTVRQARVAGEVVASSRSPTTGPSSTSVASARLPSPTAAQPGAPRPGPPRRPTVPAAVEREVRRRHGDRCQFPLDAGGVCGSTWQVELDHVVPVALGGATAPGNLRCACRAHNQAAAEEALGPAVMRAGRRRGARPGTNR